MRTRLKTIPNKRGIMLIETLLYVGILAIVFGVGGSLLYRAWAGNIAIRRNADDITNALRAGELWRSDIRAATGSIELRDQELHVPIGNGEIIYAFNDGTVSRKASGKPQRVLGRVKSSAMQQDRRSSVTAWRWELELISDRKNVQLKPLFTFQAVAGSEASK